MVTTYTNAAPVPPIRFVDLQKMAAEFARRKPEEKPEVWVYPGTLEEFGEAIGSNSVQVPQAYASMISSLVCRQFQGKTYIGTEAAVRKALPFFDSIERDGPSGERRW